MSYIRIYDWMMSKGLKLKGCELLLYGLVVSYTMQGTTLFEKEEALACRFGFSREHICRSIKVLLEKGYIVRVGRHPGAETYDYIANQSVLDQLKTTCDILSHIDVNFHHITMEDKVSSSSDHKSHDKRKKNIENDKEDTAPSIIHFENHILQEKWNALMKSAKWRKRTSESLAAAERKLKSYAPELAILMITNTIEGDYPKIYDPSPEMIAKVQNMTSSSKAKTQIDSDMFKEDDTLFGKIYCIIPEIYRAVAIGQSKQRRRALSFMTNTSKSVIKVFYPSGMKGWIDEKKTTIEKTLSVEGLTTEFQYVED